MKAVMQGLTRYKAMIMTTKEVLSDLTSRVKGLESLLVEEDSLIQRRSMHRSNSLLTDLSHGVTGYGG